MYRLRLVKNNRVYQEVFKEDLGSLHLLAEKVGYYGQTVVIHEVIKALDKYEELSVVDVYTLTGCQRDAITGSERPLRAHLRGSDRSQYQKT